MKHETALHDKTFIITWNKNLMIMAQVLNLYVFMNITNMLGLMVDTAALIGSHCYYSILYCKTQIV